MTTPGARGGRDADVAEALVTLADTLVADYDVVDLMDRLVTTAMHLLDGAAGGVLLRDQRGGLQLVASSTEEMRLLELFQLQNHEGPCLDCIAQDTTISVDDLAEAASRWPRFTAEARRAGFRSVHAVPMRLRDEVIGGLNLFQTDQRPLGPREKRVAQALADIATIGVLQQRSVHRAALLAEQLQSALDTRIAIEQAKGVVAVVAGVDMDTAYRRIRRYARDHNLTMGAVSAAVVNGDDVVRAVADLPD
ncbi:MAG: GAF domain-containing protein [Actinomycetes bacterium]